MEPSKPGGEANDAKQPYTAPKLVRLGSVRDLTFGASGTKGDGVLSKKTKDF